MAKLLFGKTNVKGEKVVKLSRYTIYEIIKEICCDGDQGGLEFLRFFISELNLESLVSKTMREFMYIAVGNVEIGKELLEELLKYPRASINKCFLKTSPLMAACVDGNVKVVKYLLQTLVNEKDDAKKVNVNIQGNLNGDHYKKVTALHLACQFGNVEVVKLLLQTLKLEDKDRQVNLNLKNSDGKTALDLARLNNHQEIVEMLQVNFS